MKIKCERCGHSNEVNPAALLGSSGGSATSKAKTNAARRNAKKGGWPKGKKRGKRPTDANALAHSVVADAEKLTLRVVPRPQEG